MSNYNTRSIAAADAFVPALVHTLDEQVVLKTMLRSDAVSCPQGLSSRQCVMRIVRISLETGVSMTVRQVGDALLELHGWSISDRALAAYCEVAVEAYT
jgi:hypothetical protein